MTESELPPLREQILKLSGLINDVMDLTDHCRAGATQIRVLENLLDDISDSLQTLLLSVERVKCVSTK